jgi:hypothetical protein
MSDLIFGSEKPEDILTGFHDQGITHMLVNYPIFERWMSDNFSQEKQKLTQILFQKYTGLLFLNNGFGLSILKFEDMNEF